MDASAFLRSVERGQLPSVALVHGSDAQLLDDALGTLTRALFADPGAAALDREVFDARESAPEAIVNAALTLPLAAPKRLVALRHCQALAARGAELLARYLERPSPTTCLLLLADEPLGASRERKQPHWLLSALPASAVVEVGPRRGRALAEWLRERAQAEGITVSDEAARLLVQWVGEESATLLGEVRKAAVAGGADNRAVGVHEVTAVVGEHRIAGVFELTRAVERRELGLALRTLDRLLATEEPIFILGGLTRDVRAAWMAREGRERGRSPADIARALGRPPAVVEALLASIAAVSPATLVVRLRRCWEVERRLKSGGEPRAEMTALVIELCR